MLDCTYLCTALYLNSASLQKVKDYFILTASYCILKKSVRVHIYTLTKLVEVNTHFPSTRLYSNWKRLYSVPKIEEENHTTVLSNYIGTGKISNIQDSNTQIQG